MSKELLYTKPSSPVLNYIKHDQRLMEAYSWNVMLMHYNLKQVNKSLVEAMSVLKGNHDYCATLTHKNWIWDREDYRIFVSKSGVSIELFDNEASQPDNVEQTLKDIFQGMEMDYYVHPDEAAAEVKKTL